MTPYLQQQLGYLLAAGASSGALWIASGRLRALKRRPWLRLLALALALAAPIAGAAFLLRRLDHPHSTYQFGLFALGFYSASIWIPALLLVDVVKRWRSGLPLESLLVLLALGLAGAGAYSLLVEPNRLVTTRELVQIPAWSEEVPELRIVHVSDLQSVGFCERERRAAEMINALEPDLIVMTGDYAAGPFDDPRPAVDAARRFLSSLRATHGIICLAGHSESDSLRRTIFDGLELTYLRNQELELDLSVDGRQRRLRLLAVTAHGPDFSIFARREEPGLATLALSHEPDASWEFEGLGVDLHLAGHTHGGQICLPFYGPPFTLSDVPRRFARGLHRFGDHWLHVSPGIGMEGNHAPRVRFLCPPSIDLLILQGGGEALPPKAVPPRG